MRSLSQPTVLARAALAALLTTLACLPELATSPKNVIPVSISASMFCFCVFLLWAFVLAWQLEYSGRPVFKAAFKPGLWAGATLYGLAAGLLVHFLIDPPLRQIAPDEYPSTVNAWLATSLFQLGFGPLYICFAPFAFFIRLTRRPQASTALVVVWTVFVEFLVLSNHHVLPPVWVTVALMLRSVIAGFVAVYLYLNGGALLVWWVGSLIQLRLLLDVLRPHN